eukprot:203675-Pyramimonas_sp.AAC.2
MTIKTCKMVYDHARFSIRCCRTPPLQLQLPHRTPHLLPRTAGARGTPKMTGHEECGRVEGWKGGETCSNVAM